MKDSVTDMLSIKPPVGQVGKYICTPGGGEFVDEKRPQNPETACL